MANNQYLGDTSKKPPSVLAGLALVAVFPSCTLTSEPFEAFTAPAPVDMPLSETRGDLPSSTQSLPAEEEVDERAAADLAPGPGNGRTDPVSDSENAQEPQVQPANGALSSETLLVPNGSGVTDAGLFEGGAADAAPIDAGTLDAGDGDTRVKDFAVGDSGVDASIPAALARCEGTVFEGSCYDYQETRTSFAVAQQRCTDRNAHLLFLESQREEDFVVNWLVELGVAPGRMSGAWLGARDAETDGQFFWEDGVALTYFNFAGGLPDDGEGIQCLELRMLPGGRPLWFDRPCQRRFASICERPL